MRGTLLTLTIDMTRYYIIKALIGQLILFAISFGPVFGLCYWGYHHMWSTFLFGIGLQILALFILLAYLLGTCGFLDKTPDEEYVGQLIDEINYFHKRGYQVNQTFGNGSFHPGVTLVKPGMPEITVILNYQPFKCIFSTSLVFKQYGKVKSYQYDTHPDMLKFARIFDKWFGPGYTSIPDLTAQDFCIKARMKRIRRATPIPKERALVLVDKKEPVGEPVNIRI